MCIHADCWPPASLPANRLLFRGVCACCFALLCTVLGALVPCGQQGALPLLLLLQSPTPVSGPRAHVRVLRALTRPHSVPSVGVGPSAPTAHCAQCASSTNATQTQRCPVHADGVRARAGRVAGTQAGQVRTEAHRRRRSGSQTPGPPASSGASTDTHWHPLTPPLALPTARIPGPGSRREPPAPAPPGHQSELAERYHNCCQH